MTQRRVAQAGFTLVELLAVLVIAALILAFVLPFGGGLPRRAELAGAADRLAAALRTTRSLAIRHDRSEALLVDVRAARYYAAGAAGPGSFPAGAHLTLTTIENERQGDQLGAIRFFPDGSSTGGGIAIEEGTLRYEVLIDWLTGRVSIRAGKS